MIAEGRVGPRVLNDGTEDKLRLDRVGGLVVTPAHATLQETALRGNLYSGGMTLTSISSALFTTATLDATAKPIVGLWNPLASGVNLVVLQVKLQITLTALQNTGPGAFMWATSTNNGALTLGSTPLNRKTLTASGSMAKELSGIVLTGLTNSLVVREAAGVAGGNINNIATLDTAAGFSTLITPSIEYVDGGLIVPPGGVLALLAVTTPVAHSAATGIVWEEVPV